MAVGEECGVREFPCQNISCVRQGVLCNCVQLCAIVWACELYGLQRNLIERHFPAIHGRDYVVDALIDNGSEIDVRDNSWRDSGVLLLLCYVLCVVVVVVVVVVFKTTLDIIVSLCFRFRLFIYV